MIKYGSSVFKGPILCYMHIYLVNEKSLTPGAPQMIQWARTTQIVLKYNTDGGA